MENSYNPDVLNCIASLSNDEVFTPPSLANSVLDLLPQEIFSNPATKFLDPFTKSGVFLREIVKRLDMGLEHIIPDRQQRIDHIMHEQVFGIACAELTALLSRRSVYCSKSADGKYSVSRFDTPQGNIRYRDPGHTWAGPKCRFCGASREVYDRGEESEQYAYPFIHTDSPSQLIENMTFDVIIGNPPYQMSDGGNNASAKPLYHLFVEQALKLSPRYLTMIIPARWYSGGKGLDSFRDMMLNDRRMSRLVDYFDSTECFPGIDLAGGVCYFLWDSRHNGDCIVESHINGVTTVSTRPLMEQEADSFIRFNEAISILKKVQKYGERSFSQIISSRKPFGITTKSPLIQSKNGNGLVKIYAYPINGYIRRENISENETNVDKEKVFISYAYGERGDFPYFVLGKPFVGERGTCCSETYLMIGPVEDESECQNIISYIRTKFFRFLVLLKKNTQHATSKVYQFVPLQDFSHPWTDGMLYDKYGLSKEEIDFIDSMIRPME